MAHLDARNARETNPKFTNRVACDSGRIPFFGIGAYGVAIALTRLGPSWAAVGAGTAAALALSFALSLVIGLFSLWVKAIFYAMITLAVAAAFQTFASQLSDITGGEDGLNFKVPEMLSPGYSLAEQPFLGISLDGRRISYYVRCSGASCITPSGAAATPRPSSCGTASRALGAISTTSPRRCRGATA